MSTRNRAEIFIDTLTELIEAERHLRKDKVQQQRQTYAERFRNRSGGERDLGSPRPLNFDDDRSA